MNNIPDKLINFMCYDDGNVMIGIADVALPDLAYMTESMQGAGIAGEIDAPTLGHFQSLTATINWRSLIKENVTYIAPKTYHFDFRGSVQIYDPNSGEFTTQSLKCVMKVLPKNLNLGNLNVASQMGTSGGLEIVYLKIEIAEKEVVEIDKLSFICRIDGTDYLEKVRKDMGMA